jgi:hypothetical protein
VRAYTWIAAAVVVAAMAAPAHAQANIGAKNPGPIVYKLINPTSSTTIAPPQTGVFSGSKLASFFHWPTPPSNMQVVGTSSFPAPGAMPGPAYLQSFGFSQPKAAPTGPSIFNFFGF